MSPRMLQWARWPLWSWRNLAVSTLAVLVLLALVGRLTSATASSSGAATDPASAPTPLSTATSQPSVESIPGTSALTRTATPSVGATTSASTVARSVAGEDGALIAAVRFVTAWARPDASAQAWLTSLRPLCTAAFQLTLETSDPGRVPASRVTGPARVGASSSGALVMVPTDAGAVVVSVVREGDVWKVVNIAPDDPPPGAPTPTLTGGAR